MVCELGAELPTTRYTDHKGRAKVVRYWVASPLRGTFTPNDEVDEVRWATPEAAAALLTYDRDQVVLRAAVAPGGH